MWTSKAPTGLYCVLSAGMWTTSRKTGSLEVVYPSTSHWLITKSHVPVWSVLVYLRRLSYGRANTFAVDARATFILIWDYGVWCRTSCTASPLPPLRLRRSTYIQTVISYQRDTRRRSKMRLDRGAYLARLKDQASQWFWGSATSRWVNADPNG